MARFILTVTTPLSVPPVTKRFFVTAVGVRQALNRLFQQKPEFDIASLVLGIQESTDEDIT